MSRTCRGRDKGPCAPPGRRVPLTAHPSACPSPLLPVAAVLLFAVALLPGLASAIHHAAAPAHAQRSSDADGVGSSFQQVASALVDSIPSPRTFVAKQAAKPLLPVFLEEDPSKPGKCVPDEPNIQGILPKTCCGEDMKCPFRNGVCCAGNSHCCPETTVCVQGDAGTPPGCLHVLDHPQVRRVLGLPPLPRPPPPPPPDPCADVPQDPCKPQCKCDKPAPPPPPAPEPAKPETPPAPAEDDGAAEGADGPGGVRYEDPLVPLTHNPIGQMKKEAVERHHATPKEHFSLGTPRDTFNIPGVKPPPTVEKLNVPVDLNALKQPSPDDVKKVVNGLPAGSHLKPPMDFSPGELLYPHRRQGGRASLSPAEIEGKKATDQARRDATDASKARHVIIDLKVGTKPDPKKMGAQLIREDDVSYKVAGNIVGPGAPTVDLGRMIRFREVAERPIGIAADGGAQTADATVAPAASAHVDSSAPRPAHQHAATAARTGDLLYPPDVSSGAGTSEDFDATMGAPIPI